MSNGKIETCMDLLELINQQEKIIAKQNETIAKLVNKNLEQENIISTLMRDFEV